MVYTKQLRLIFHRIIHCNYLLINNQVPRHKLLVRNRIIHAAAQWEYWEYLFIESELTICTFNYYPRPPVLLTTITFESNEPWEKLISWRRADLVSESKAGTDIIPGTCGFLPPQIHIVKTGPDPKITNFQDVKMSVLIRGGGDDKQTTARELITNRQNSHLSKTLHWPNITEYKAHRSNGTHHGSGLTTLLITTSHNSIVKSISVVNWPGLDSTLVSWPGCYYCPRSSSGFIDHRSPSWCRRMEGDDRTQNTDPGPPRLKLQCRGWGCERPGPILAINLNSLFSQLIIKVTLNRNVFIHTHFTF